MALYARRNSDLNTTLVSAIWAAPDALLYTADMNITDEWLANAGHLGGEASRLIQRHLLIRLRDNISEAYRSHPNGWPWEHLTWEEVLTAR